MAASQMVIHEIREIYCDGLVKVRRWFAEPSARPYPLEPCTLLTAPGPRQQDGDLLEVGINYLFRDPMVRLVAISDPTSTADGLNFQSKVLWEAAEVHPSGTGGSYPPALPWGVL